MSIVLVVLQQQHQKIIEATKDVVSMINETTKGHVAEFVSVLQLYDKAVADSPTYLVFDYE